MSCINKKSPEYQTLKNKSGIKDFILEAICRDFVDKHQRFPYLDELSDVNSEPHLKERLSINSYGTSNIDTILEQSGTDTLEEAVINLNNEYRDLEIDVTPIQNEAFVDIEHRPTDSNFDINPVQVDSKPNDYDIFNNALIKLSSLYGIKFNGITDAELNSELWQDVPGVSDANAFIYNGEIYINLNKSSVDAPLHELMHLLIGSMRFTDSANYQKLIASIENIPNLQELAQQYPNRTANDIKEEIFVTEVAKHLTGQSSFIDNLDSNIRYEILYNTRRLLDSILMGQDSVKTISPERLFNMSLKELTQEVNSTIMTNQFKGFIYQEGSELHRKINNIKSDLLKNKLLEEYCE